MLPEAIKSFLSLRYSGWKFPIVSKDIREWLKKRHPFVVSGDFDGNGKKDYAVQIIHRKKRLLIAFLYHENKFKEYILEDYLSNGEDNKYIYLMKKGEKDYDWEKGKYFRYQNDSIGVGYFEVSSWSYIFKDGKFHQVTTSD